jgi:NADP-dependent 3-hydroxy acid dehydrogenase YdfG
MPARQGTTAVVTGASSSIGRATAERLAAEGSHVFVNGRSLERLEALARTIESAERQAWTHLI